MSQPPKPHRPGPPHNPDVRELIAARRKWSSPPKREDALLGFRGWHERGYLPHRGEPGLTQFITFNLMDSYPVSLRSEWEALHKIEDDRERRKQLEAYFRFYHGKRYELLAWVVMPNHIHALFKGTMPLGKIVGDFKEYTAREANKLLSRRGQFWAQDYWDTFMRDAQHELKTKRYIENNPVKAFLARDPKDWPWSSARFRDESGVLRL